MCHKVVLGTEFFNEQTKSISVKEQSTLLLTKDLEYWNEIATFKLIFQTINYLK